MRFSISLISTSLARLRVAMVCRTRVNRPSFCFPRMCLVRLLHNAADVREAEESKVSGFPSPSPIAAQPRSGRTRSGGSCRVQRQTELRQPLPQIAEKPLGISMSPEADDCVVGVADDDDLAGRLPLALLVRPEVVDASQVDVRGFGATAAPVTVGGHAVLLESERRRFNLGCRAPPRLETHCATTKSI
jgi:hypothetical protein